MTLKAWASIAAGEYDQDSPFDVTLATKLRDRFLHLKQILDGDSIHAGKYPHSHDGDGSSALSGPYSGNLVKDFCPDSGADGEWRYSGFSTSNDNGIETTTTTAHYAYQLLMYTASVSKATIGSGADLTVSIMVRPKTGAPTTGELWFGIADGATTFKANCTGKITASGITTTKRYYMHLTAASVGSFSTDCRVLIKNGTTAPDAQLYVSGIDVRAGLALAYPEPAMNEDSSDGEHDDWKRFSLTSMPIYEKATAITSATSVTGV